VSEILVDALGVYVALGLVFAVGFALRGAARIDPDARGATWGFKLLIVPGSAALWPLLLVRWMRAQGPPVEKSPHRLGARPAPREGA